jgi:hypothetical protein
MGVLGAGSRVLAVQLGINYAHLDSLLLQLNRVDLSIASPEDRRRLYGALRLEVSVDEDRTIRLSGVFDPDVYLPGILEDPGEWLAPRSEVTEGTSVWVVSLDSTPPGTYSPTATNTRRSRSPPSSRPALTS